MLIEGGYYWIRNIVIFVMCVENFLVVLIFWLFINGFILEISCLFVSSVVEFFDSWVILFDIVWCILWWNYMCVCSVIRCLIVYLICIFICVCILIISCLFVIFVGKDFIRKLIWRFIDICIWEKSFINVISVDVVLSSWYILYIIWEFI